MKYRLSDFIENELTEMGQNILASSLDNLEHRKANPFNVFKNESIERNMALGRSFDSQLGTRLQRIAMYLAREKYGIRNVPNHLLLQLDKSEDFHDVVNILGISIPDDYSTQKFYRIKDDTDLKNFIVSLSHKHNISENALIMGQGSFLCNNMRTKRAAQKIKFINNYPKGTPVDLMYIIDQKPQTIYTYELKAGGNLDTKNCRANATEVLNLLDIFSFFPENHSYFATCYNNRGEYSYDRVVNDGVIYRSNRPTGSIFDVFSKQDNNVLRWRNMRNRILVGSVFWEQVLPDEIKYDEFIEIYHKAFITSKIEEMITGKATL